MRVPPFGSSNGVRSRQAGLTVRRRERSGTASVEFALLLALFLGIFIYGMMEVNRAVMVAQVMTNAARAGCRQGVQSGNGNSDITTAVDGVMKANNLPNYEPVAITVSDPNNPTNTNDASTASTGSLISVQVSMKASNFAWFGTYIFFHSAAKNGTDTIVHSQNLTMKRQ